MKISAVIMQVFPHCCAHNLIKKKHSAKTYKHTAGMKPKPNSLFSFETQIRKIFSFGTCEPACGCVFGPNQLNIFQLLIMTAGPTSRHSAVALPSLLVANSPSVNPFSSPFPPFSQASTSPVSSPASTTSGSLKTFF